MLPPPPASPCPFLCPFKTPPPSPTINTYVRSYIFPEEKFRISFWGCWINVAVRRLLQRQSCPPHSAITPELTSLWRNVLRSYRLLLFRNISLWQDVLPFWSWRRGRSILCFFSLFFCICPLLGSGCFEGEMGVLDTNMKPSSPLEAIKKKKKKLISWIPARLTCS